MYGHPSRPHRHARPGYHHLRVYRTAAWCWLWACPCGGGIHDAHHGLPTQHAAFIAALEHTSRNPGR